MEEFIETYSKIAPGQRYLMAVGAAILIIAAYYTLYNQGQQAELEALAVELAAEQVTREEKEDFVKTQHQFEEKFNNLKAQMELARKILPDDSNVPALLKELGNRARQSGLDLQQFSPQTETTTHGFYEELLFDINLEGSYHEIATFVNSVGKMDRIVNISKINLSSPQTINQKIILKGDFTVKTYRFINESEKDKDKKDKDKKKKKKKGGK
jgi:type IV pilus assembly protein PilO